MAVTLIAATQRPTQKAMGQGALRVQMDVRIYFRIRERKDVDLILGQGMLTVGWQAHKLNAPGKFLISAAEHDTPRRARAYLLTDEAVSSAATQHPVLRHALDEVSQRARDERTDVRPPAPGQASSSEEAEHAEELEGSPKLSCGRPCALPRSMSATAVMPLPDWHDRVTYGRPER